MTHDEKCERIRGEAICRCAIIPTEELRKMEAVVAASKCIRHWHDREAGGMVVCAQAVHNLWDSLHDLESTRNQKNNRTA